MRRWRHKWVWVLIALPLAAHELLPVPRKLALSSETFRIDASWRIVGATDGVAAEYLREELASRFRLRLDGRGPAIRLAMAESAVAVGEAQDRDRAALAEQAYRIELAPDEVRITANAPAGLFYGAATLVQLIGADRALPRGEIVDWPDLQYRAIYWDDAHHLDRLPYLKQAVRTAASFKINAFAIKLEGHFQYRSAPAIVEPYAMSPGELQELTDYGLRYHVEVVPYLDGPGHVAFILKHPEYAKLREYAGSNYELCATNPATYDLLRGMFGDLLDANRGSRWFYLSTDEAYYIGLARNAQCDEATRATELGSPGKLLAEFLDKTAGYLHERGRTVMFWGEAPLKASDIPSLPPYLVNGETYGKEFDAAFRARGIREMVYVSTQGEERLFPDYFLLPAAARLHANRPGRPRIEEATAKIANDPARKDGDVMGAVVAAWADAGLHTETFWLGYATIASAAWNPAQGDAAGLRRSFYRQFYGAGSAEMERVYELMSRQAQWWGDTWETAPSKDTKPILGNSRGMFDAPRPRNDQRLPLPVDAKRLEVAAAAMRENDELLRLLDRNVRSVERNRYGLEVFRTIAMLCRHNLRLIAEIGRAPGEATLRKMAADRESVLRELTAVWEKTWYPRVAEANGRRFLHDLDDVKDHVPDREIGMRYLVVRDESLGK